MKRSLNKQGKDFLLVTCKSFHLIVPCLREMGHGRWSCESGALCVVDSCLCFKKQKKM